MKRVLLVLTVVLVMAAMVLASALPVFAQAAEPCEGTTPASPPQVGGSPAGTPPETPPGGTVREPPPPQSRGGAPFTGPYNQPSCTS